MQYKMKQAHPQPLLGQVRWEAASEAVQRMARSSRSRALRSASARAISISISTSSCARSPPLLGESIQAW